METSAISSKFTGLLGFNAGYVDTAGFLALHGLFTAHVTGNFVTLGAALIHGTSGTLSKLIALPVFCIFVILSRAVSSRMTASASLKGLLCVKTLLLLIAAIILVIYGPFANSDDLPALSAGVILVAAMALQNAAQRMFLTSVPPTTLMTGTTTQVMIDVTDLMHEISDDNRKAAVGRLRKMIPVIAVFALGCGLAAAIYMAAGMWCFVIPPVVSVASYIVLLISQKIAPVSPI